MAKYDKAALALFVASLVLNVYLIYAPWKDVRPKGPELTMLYPACDYFPNGLRGIPCVNAVSLLPAN